jgi:hypothetical protein
LAARPQFTARVVPIAPVGTVRTPVLASNATSVDCGYPCSCGKGWRLQVI